MNNQQEKQNRVVALLYSFGVHAIILLLVFFVVSWKAPDPPLGELGNNLALGFDDQGSGDVQPTEPIGSEKATEQTSETKTEEPKPEEVVEEKVKPTEAEPEKIATSTDEESPVTVKETKKEKVQEKPVEEKIKPKVEEKPVAVYKAATTTKTDDNSSEKAGKPGNQGDDVNKQGDKGNPNGNVDGKALYGKPGNGNGGGGTGGTSIEISGWQWDDKPNPTVSTNESGRVVFEIKVDENGDILSIRTLERSISAEAEQICKKSVEKLSFIKTGTNVPEVSTGKITFVIRSK